MFDWRLFVTLVLVCIPGIVVATPATIGTLVPRLERRRPASGSTPPLPLLIALASLQTLALVAIAAAIGTAVAPRTGLRAPFFEALVAGAGAWGMLTGQLLPTLVVGGGGTVVFLIAYYRIFRPRLDHETVTSTDGLRMSLGIWGRVLYGGIVEEVLIRWGLMGGLAWLGVLLLGALSPVVAWATIVGSGVVFALGHIPGLLAAGARRSPAFFASVIFLNLWAGLLFGWLYWQVGLAAAMLAHMLFHLLWWPLDLATAGRSGTR